MTGKGRLATLAFCAAAGCTLWFVAGRGTSPPPTPPSIPLPGPAPAPPPVATPAVAPVPAGIVAGTVTRQGKPRAATVTATLVREAPADPDSREAWDRAWDEKWGILDLHDGLEASPRAKVSAGPDGTWSIGGLRPGEYQFEARDADGWRGSEYADVGSRGAPVPWHGEVVEPVEIPLSPAPCALRGRARNPDGTPFDGFLVARLHYETFLPAKTDAGGRFAIEGLPEATIFLSALVPGRREMPLSAVILPSGPVEFTVGAGSREIEGAVLEDATGKAVPGAAVTEDWSSNHDDGGERFRADASGRFQVRLFPGRTTRVIVEAEGFVPLEDSRDLPATPPAGPLEFRLRRPADLRGRVSTTTGAPAAGAEVVVLPDTRVPGTDERGRRATADAEGKYEFRGVPSGPAVVLVAGGGFVSRSLLGPTPWDRGLDTVSLAEGAAASRDLVAAPCSRARGRVVDFEGRGIAGARVIASQEDSVEVESLPPAVALSPEIRTAADGSFALPFLLPGFETVVTAKREKGPLAPGRIPPLAPGADSEVEIRAPRERSLDVRIRESGTGRAMAGVRVDVEAELVAGSWLEAGDDWATDGEGRARVGPVPATPLRIRAMGGEPFWLGEWMEVKEADQGPFVLEVDPGDPPGSLPIEGRVLLPDGSPAAGATVECGTDGMWTCMGFTGDEVETDAEGRFRVRNLHPAGYEVRARIQRAGRNLAGAVKAEGGARDVVIPLADEARRDAWLDTEDGIPRILLRVLGPSRKPVTAGDAYAYFVGVEGERDNAGLTLCDGLCAFELPEWSPGARLWIHVTHAMDAGAPPSSPAHGVFGPFPCTGKEIEVVLSAGSAIEGRVLDAEGKGIPGAHVNLLYAGKEGPGGVIDLDCRIADEFADAEGRFRIEGTADHDYTLVAESEPGYCDSERVPVHGGAKDVRISLRPAITVLVTVLDPAGNPVPGAEVRAEQEGEWGTRRPHGRTNAAGMVRLEGLDPSRPAALGALPPKSRGDLPGSKRKGWIPADTTVRLQ